MPIVFDKKEITKALKFRGVVVESVIVPATDQIPERWRMTIYNRQTGQFNREDVREVDPTSRGYTRSALYERWSAWDRQGVNPSNAEGYEGYEMDFDTKIVEFNGNVATRSLPTGKVGKVSSSELATLKAQLQAIRSQQTTQPPTPTHTERVAEEDLDALLALYAGKTDEEVIGEAFRTGLPLSITKLVTSGEAVRILMGQGRLDIDEEGRYQAT